MDELISFYIEHDCSVSTRVLFTHAWDLFNALELDNFEDDFVNILMISDNSDPEDIQTAMNGKLYSTLKAILNDYEVYINDDVDLADLLEIVECVSKVEYYEDTESLAKILDDGNDKEELFCEVMNVVGRQSVEWWLVRIRMVSVGLIDAIKALVNKKIDAEEARELTSHIHPMHDKMITRIHELASLLDTDNLYALQYIKDQYPIGMEFEFYVAPYILQLATMSPDQAANEILSLLWISSDGFMDAITTFRKHSENIFSSIEKITAVDVRITKLLEKYDLYYHNPQGVKNAQV